MPRNIFNEIGGNYWLSPDQYNDKSDELPNLSLDSTHKDIFFTSSGRGAINLVLQQLKISRKQALLPEFTCESVIKPFIDAEFNVAFYGIEKDLTINMQQLKKNIHECKPSVLFLQSYFGFDTLKNNREEIIHLKRKFCFIIVEDITHSWLSNSTLQGADYYVASLRKWLEIPDGGLIISPSELINTNKVNKSEDTEILNLFVKASRLKHEYTQKMDSRLKPIFRNYFYTIEQILTRRDIIYPISSISKNIISKTNFEKIKTLRNENFRVLLSCSLRIQIFRPCFNILPRNITPLYFPVFVKGNRDELQRKLASQRIYAPILWPISQFFNTGGSKLSKFLYEKLLCLPCDQRYRETEMKRIIKICEEYV